MDWVRHKPIWLLKMESTSANAGDAKAALDELLRRLIEPAWFGAANGLTESQIGDLVEHALSIQAVPNVAWHAEWGEVIEFAWRWRDGAVTDEQLKRYLRNAVQPGIRITPRKCVQSGGLLPVQVEYPPCRSASDSFFLARFEIVSANIGDWNLSRDILIEEPRAIQASKAFTDWKYPIVGLDPGKYTLSLTYRTTILAKEQYQLKAVLDWITEESVEIAVVPRGQSTVSLIRDPTFASAVRASIGVKPLQPEPEAAFDIRPYVAVHPCPVSMAFEVLVRTGRQEVKVAHLVSPTGGIPRLDLWLPDPSLGTLLTESTSVDLVFRPSPGLAERTVEIFNMWDEELVVRDVPVQAPNP